MRRKMSPLGAPCRSALDSPPYRRVYGALESGTGHEDWMVGPHQSNPPALAQALEGLGKRWRRASGPFGWLAEGSHPRLEGLGRAMGAPLLSHGKQNYRRGMRFGQKIVNQGKARYLRPPVPILRNRVGMASFCVLGRAYMLASAYSHPSQSGSPGESG